MEKNIHLVSTYGKAGRLDGESIQRKKAPSVTVSDGWLSHHTLDRCICWLVSCSGEEPASTIIHQVRNEIRSKRRGYQEQDRKRGWDPASVLSDTEVAEKMLVQRQKCWHCGSIVHVLYRDRYDPLQWSVDRLDNDIGHTRDNVVISCMRCNLRRGNKSIRTFTAVKESTG